MRHDLGSGFGRRCDEEAKGEAPVGLAVAGGGREFVTGRCAAWFCGRIWLRGGEPGGERRGP